MEYPCACMWVDGGEREREIDVLDHITIDMMCYWLCAQKEATHNNWQALIAKC